MSSFIRYMGLFHISYWNKLFISRQANVCNAQWPHCNKEIKSLIYEEYMHDTFGDIGLRHLICRRYVCHWHFLQLQTHICSHFSVVMCHGCLYCFTGLAVSWSPYSAHTYIPRLLHCSDCFTVSTRCTYTDLGSRWYFGVYFRSCLRVCVCVCDGVLLTTLRQKLWTDINHVFTVGGIWYKNNCEYGMAVRQSASGFTPGQTFSHSQQYVYFLLFYHTS